MLRRNGLARLLNHGPFATKLPQLRKIAACTMGRALLSKRYYQGPAIYDQRFKDLYRQNLEIAKQQPNYREHEWEDHSKPAGICLGIRGTMPWQQHQMRYERMRRCLKCGIVAKHTNSDGWTMFSHSRMVAAVAAPDEEKRNAGHTKDMLQLSSSMADLYGCCGRPA